MIISKFSDHYDFIRSEISRPQPYFIYGAGENGKIVADYLNDYPCKLQGFCDSDINKHGAVFCGQKVVSPQQAVDSGLLIVVASTWYPQIIQNLQDLGAERFINLSLIGRAKEAMVDDVRKRLEKLSGMLDDDGSKGVLDDLLGFLLSDGDQRLAQSRFPQYLHWELAALEDIKLIDGGGCKGESLETFQDYLDGHIRMVCLEPEPDNVLTIEKKVKDMELSDQVEVIASGLWSCDTQLRFATASVSGSHANCSITDTGNVTVDVRSIDSVCEELEFCPNLIKMDIEGAEVEALKGAATTIVKHRPKLAICLYHDLDDLWVIPDYIKSLRPDYKMSLGHHSSGWFETVLYCY
jgi:FkbM family methyltransferase